MDIQIMDKTTMENTANEVKKFGQKVKEFVEENRQMILIIAGAIAAVAAVCVAIKLLCRNK